MKLDAQLYIVCVCVCVCGLCVCVCVCGLCVCVCDLSLEYGDSAHTSHPSNPNRIERLQYNNSRSREPLRNLTNLPLVKYWRLLLDVAQEALTSTKFGLLAILSPYTIFVYSLCTTLCFYCFTIRVFRGWLLYHDPTCRQCSLFVRHALLSMDEFITVLPSFFLMSVATMGSWCSMYIFLVDIARWLYCAMNEVNVDSVSFLYHSS